MLNVRDTSDYMKSVSAYTGKPLVTVSFSLVDASISLTSSKEILETLEFYMAPINEDMVYSLEEGQYAICEMSSVREAISFMADLSEIFEQMPSMGLIASLYHDGELTDEARQITLKNEREEREASPVSAFPAPHTLQ